MNKEASFSQESPKTTIEVENQSETGVNINVARRLANAALEQVIFPVIPSAGPNGELMFNRRDTGEPIEYQLNEDTNEQDQ